MVRHLGGVDDARRRLVLARVSGRAVAARGKLEELYEGTSDIQRLIIGRSLFKCSDLTPLLNPRSVAVVGASDDPAKWGFGIARGVLRGADRRRVELVNARSPSVQGLPTVASLRDLAEPVDLAVLVVPARRLRGGGRGRPCAGRAGVHRDHDRVRGGGAEGRAVEERVAARVREAGAVLLGPNCMGVWSGHEAFDAAWLDQGQVPGPLAIVSQSGGLGVEFVSYGIEMALGLSHFVSIGNQADLAAGDLVAHLAGRARVRAIGVYCEDFRDGRGFLRAVAEARGRASRCVLSPTGSRPARAAQSHTGSLVSSRRVVEAALRDAGALLVATPEELMETTQGLLMPTPAARPAGRDPVRRRRHRGDRGRRPGGRRVRASRSCPTGLQAQIRDLRPGAASTRNPVDLTAVMGRPPHTYPRILDAVIDQRRGGRGGADRELRHDDARGAGPAGRDGGRGDDRRRRRIRWWPPCSGRASRRVAQLRAGGVPAFRRVGSACRALAAAAAFETDGAARHAGLAGARRPGRLPTGYLDARRAAGGGRCAVRARGGGPATRRRRWRRQGGSATRWC